MNLSDGNLIWFLWPILLVITPIILFGTPGYYGDDFNMLDSLDKHKGVLGSTLAWIDEYGIFYRPIGIFFLNSIYSIFGHNDGLMYGFSLAIYSVFIFLVYKSSIVFTSDKSLAIFIAIFFASFPFNATAFLQLSSIYMMFTGLCSLMIVMKLYSIDGKVFSNQIIFLSLAWLILLLSYEQITGLIAVLFISAFMKHIDQGFFYSFKSSIQLNGFFIICTLFFISVFFFSPNNPKVITLNELNDFSTTLNEPIMQNGVSEDLTSAMAQTNSFSQSRFDAVNSKVKKSLLFFSHNLSYAINEIIKRGSKGWFLLLLLFFTAILILFSPIQVPSKKLALRQTLFGLTWFSSTLAPFFLYKSVHIPPYVLLIPSIGLAYSTYGLFWLLQLNQYKNFSIYLFKTILVLIVINFQIQQYGYFFGLKEELLFWNSAAVEFERNKSQINEEGTIEIKTLRRNNLHIFWLEKLVGRRYFFNKIGYNSSELSINYLSESNTLIISDNNS